MSRDDMSCDDMLCMTYSSSSMSFLIMVIEVLVRKSNHGHRCACKKTLQSDIMYYKFTLYLILHRASCYCETLHYVVAITNIHYSQLY